MFFHQRFVPGLAIYSYLVGDEKSKQCAVVDPTRDVDELLRVAQREGLRVTHVLETHVHADFVTGSREIKQRLGDAVTIHCSGLGGEEWTPPFADHVVRDGDEFTMGSLRIRALHTPGHTPEHVSWAVFDDARSKDAPWMIFTGDFLFVGDVGRPDLLGEAAREKLARQLYHSVFEVTPAYADFTEIFPAHGAGSLCGKALGSRGSSTLGYERRFNASMQKDAQAAWVARLLEGMPVAPRYFLRMKKINREGPPVLGDKLPGRRGLSPSEVAAHSKQGNIVLDVRAKEAYSAAHVPGSISIPLAANLPTWAGSVLPYDKPIVLVLSDAADLDAVVTHLIRVGFDDIVGYLEGGFDAWENAGLASAALPMINVQELQRRMSAGGPLTVLDVRSESEWKAGHVKGAMHIHGGLLPDRFAEVPKNKPVAVICGSAYRASIAGSLLQREGYTDVSNVAGGMTAWKNAGLPTV